jgi:hypothetical protein
MDDPLGDMKVLTREDTLSYMKDAQDEFIALSVEDAYGE